MNHNNNTNNNTRKNQKKKKKKEEEEEKGQTGVWLEGFSPCNRRGVSWLASLSSHP